MKSKQEKYLNEINVQGTIQVLRPVPTYFYKNYLSAFFQRFSFNCCEVNHKIFPDV